MLCMNESLEILYCSEKIQTGETARISILSSSTNVTVKTEITCNTLIGIEVLHQAQVSYIKSTMTDITSLYVLLL